jgi:hypothetical protein
VTYYVYTGTGGNGEATWIQQVTNTPVVTTNIKEVLDALDSAGDIPASPVVSEIDFGWEISATSGTQAFTMNSYSLTVGRGEVLVAFFELEAQVDGLLFEMGDLLANLTGPSPDRGTGATLVPRSGCQLSMLPPVSIAATSKTPGPITNSTWCSASAGARGRDGGRPGGGADDHEIS